VDALQSIVPRAIAELLRHGPMSQGKVEVAWRAAVGDALSRVSTVRWQPNGVIEVRAADARWNRELKRSSSMILTRLKSLLGSDNVQRVSILEK
jgi:hypothetical protein